MGGDAGRRLHQPDSRPHQEEASRKVRKEEEDRTDLCTIGDRVTIEVQADGSAVIERVHPRAQVLSRASQQGGGARRPRAASKS